MTGSVKLNVDVIGSGPDIVFFHGWGMNSEVWQKTVEVLSKNYRITLIDFPGFGKNIGVPCDYQLDALTKSVFSSVPKDAVIVAWSMGGLVAMNIALKYSDHLSKLVLVSSNAQFSASQEWPSAMRKEVLDAFVENLNEDYKKTLQRFLLLQVRGGDNAKKTVCELKQRLYQYGDPDEIALRGGLQLLKNISFIEQLANIKIPVLLMFGKLDALVPIAAADEMKARLPKGKLVVFPKAAHAPFLSHFDEYIKDLSVFLKT